MTEPKCLLSHRHKWQQYQQRRPIGEACTQKPVGQAAKASEATAASITKLKALLKGHAFLVATGCSQGNKVNGMRGMHCLIHQV